MASSAVRRLRTLMPTPRTLTRFVIYDSRFTIYDSRIHAARKSYNVNRKSEMKLLVFAHTPPPHHGQSYMVQLMLAGFGGDRRRRRRQGGDSEGEPEVAVGGPFGIECYHVNARLSQKLEDIGDLRIGKFILLLGYCLQAIWCRFRYGVTNLYYIPAPGKRSALYRDWLVMFLCRPFFKHTILHWHAAGLAKWLETALQMRARAF